MQLTDEQIQKIKSQLIEQINSEFPEDKKASAIQQIQEMEDKQLFEFLQQNNLIKDMPKQENSVQSENNNSNNQCIFCSIVNEQIPSYKIKENSEAKAFLEINPISKAHTIIIPKSHISKESELPKSALELAKEISIKIKDKLFPKDIKISSRNMFGHQIIDIIPIYNSESINSKTYKAEESELKSIQKLLISENNAEKQTSEKTDLKKEKSEKNKEDLTKFKLPKRIP